MKTLKQLLIMISENSEGHYPNGVRGLCSEIWYKKAGATQETEIVLPYEFVFMGKKVSWSFTSHIGQRRHGSYIHIFFNDKVYKGKQVGTEFVRRLFKKAFWDFIKENCFQEPAFEASIRPLINKYEIAV
jgi:RimJ/RimL family protein N-acetyltransferase